MAEQRCIPLFFDEAILCKATFRRWGNDGGGYCRQRCVAEAWGDRCPMRPRLQTGEEFRSALRLGRSPVQGFLLVFRGEAVQRPPARKRGISRRSMRRLEECGSFEPSLHLATSGAVLRLRFQLTCEPRGEFHRQVANIHRA